MIGNVCEWTRVSYWPSPHRDDDGRNDEPSDKRKDAGTGSWAHRPADAVCS
jgi:hypothetical protein